MRNVRLPRRRFLARSETNQGFGACTFTASDTSRIAAITVSGRKNGIICVLSSTMICLPSVERR